MASNFKLAQKIEPSHAPAANRDRSNDGFPPTATSTAKIPGGRSTLTQVFGGNAQIAVIPKRMEMGQAEPVGNVRQQKDEEPNLDYARSISCHCRHTVERPV